MNGEDTPQPKPSIKMCCGRQSAAGVLMARADRMEREAGELRMIADAIKDIGGEAESALHSVFCDAMRSR